LCAMTPCAVTPERNLAAAPSWRSSMRRHDSCSCSCSCAGGRVGRCAVPRRARRAPVADARSAAEASLHGGVKLRRIGYARVALPFRPQSGTYDHRWTGRGAEITYVCQAEWRVVGALPSLLSRDWRQRWRFAGLVLSGHPERGSLRRHSQVNPIDAHRGARFRAHRRAEALFGYVMTLPCPLCYGCNRGVLAAHSER